MAKQYKMLRVPADIHFKISNRAKRIGSELTKITHKPIRVSMTSILKYYANKPVEMYPQELIDFFGKNKKKIYFAGRIVW
jgi:hypothetical protein